MSKKTIIFLVLAPILAALVGLYFKTSLMVSVLLFYGPLTIWFSVKKPSQIKRAAFFSLISTGLFFVLDYIAVMDKAWFVTTIFPFRFLGVLPLEDSIWLFLGVYDAVMFYECFDEGRHHIKRTRIKYLIIVVSLMIIGLAAGLLANPAGLHIQYAYFWIGLVFGIIPVTSILWMYPALRYKFIKANIYFFFLNILFEISALKLGQWSFPGTNFIGWVHIAGVSFPLEEFFFWVSFTGIIILSYYEFYYDDQK